MLIRAGRYLVKLAESEAEVAAAQRLRYRVFVEEMGAKASPGAMAERRERDRFDPHFDHLLLIDTESEDPEVELGVVGVYRIMRRSRARGGIGFYGAAEYDLSPLDRYPREVLELGRTCIDARHRGGAGMHLLWNGLARYVFEHDIGLLFGVASFHGTDPRRYAHALSHLHHAHLAPPDIRVRALPEVYVAMDMLPPGAVDLGTAMRQMPPLIKAYIRLGGFVGDGAYIDRDFNTVDVCLLMDTGRMVERYHRFYSRQRAALDRLPG